MLTYIKGDLLAQPKGILVHGCNGTTLPAGGIAGAIFAKWPGAEDAHRQGVWRLTSSEPKDALGTISVYIPDYEGDVPDLIIINAITQSLPGAGTLSYDAIRDCFEEVGDYLTFYKPYFGNDMPIIIPKIGAGIAGGNWNIIERIIDKTISTEHEVNVYVL